MRLTKIQKKAAIELSIGTVVIIVLAMTMLILGLVLVRSIFTGATESVTTLNEKVKGEITGLFAEEGTKIGIRLGSDKLAKIEQGTQDFGIAIGATTSTGGGASEKLLKYRLELTNVDCPGFANGNIKILDHPFTSTLNSNPATQELSFEDTEGSNGYVRLVFSIPDGTEECTQRIKIHTYDLDSRPDEIASASFRVQIISGGIFS